MKKRQSELKVALVYDRVNKWGGAERVLLVLQEMFPDAPLYTSLYNPSAAKWAENFEVKASLVNKIGFLRNKHELLPVFMPIIFEAFDFSKYDLVITVTSESAKGVLTGIKTKHICICLTPTRYLWSHYNEYFSGLVGKSAGYVLGKYLKWWDKAASQRPDVMIGISTEVCKRIKKYYGRDSYLIFPPVVFDQYREKPPLRASSMTSRDYWLDNNQKVDEYYLVVSRLVKYKKVDLVIDTFNGLDKKLIIIGKGKEEKKLKKMAANNIYFIKDVSDKELINYYKNAKALIAAQYEDFGLTMVEAMSVGTPVVVYGKGGAKDIVINKINGIFFDSQTKADIINAIDYFEKIKFNKRKIMKSAKRFSKNIFKEKIYKLI